MNALLEVENLRVNYGSIPAVRDVSLIVHPGEIVGVVGANGAGKSSSLGAVAGRLPYVGTSIRLDGTPLAGYSPERVARAGVSLVPEGRHVFASLTVLENLTVGLRKSQGRHTTQSVMERFPVLGRYRDTPAGRLSGGEQQQLVLARALLTQPRLLLLDEPTLGLAPLIVNEVFALIEELRRDGLSVVLVEQHVDRVVRLADRTYVMRGGRIALSGTREQLAHLEPDAIRAAYLGEQD